MNQANGTKHPQMELVLLDAAVTVEELLGGAKGSFVQFVRTIYKTESDAKLFVQ